MDCNANVNASLLCFSVIMDCIANASPVLCSLRSVLVCACTCTRTMYLVYVCDASVLYLEDGHVLCYKVASRVYQAAVGGEYVHAAPADCAGRALTFLILTRQKISP